MINDLQVACKKEKLPSGKMVAKSKFSKTAMLGSLMIGGIISAGVDTKTGAAYDYPDVIRIELAKADDMLLPKPWLSE